MPLINRQILLVSRPAPNASVDNFRLVESPLPDLQDGQVLVRHSHLSLDPYMRGRMNEGASYADPQPLGAVMLGATVGTVLASRHPRFAEGDAVLGMGGWQTHKVVDASQPGQLQKIDTRQVPASAYLGVVGMPGITAWYGLNQIIRPQAGQTVLVTSASGAVGSVAGQLAKAQGLRVVGVAGGEAKCRHVIETLGFDACVDYKAHPDARALGAALKQACPDGIDGVFENVGGPVLDAVMLRANAFARFAMCGAIAAYDGVPMPMAAPQLIIVKRLMLQGFIITEQLSYWPAAQAELISRVAQGQLHYRESVVDGLDNAPSALLGLLRGENFGKQLVRL